MARDNEERLTQLEAWAAVEGAETDDIFSDLVELVAVDALAAFSTGVVRDAMIFNWDSEDHKSIFLLFSNRKLYYVNAREIAAAEKEAIK